MSNTPGAVDNFYDDELRSMINADKGVDGATHPLVATAVLAASMAFCPTTSCTKQC